MEGVISSKSVENTGLYIMIYLVDGVHAVVGQELLDEPPLVDLARHGGHHGLLRHLIADGANQGGHLRGQRWVGGTDFLALK